MKLCWPPIILSFLVMFSIAAPVHNSGDREIRVDANMDNPLVLDEYGAISKSDELIRIEIAVGQLRKLEGVKALFLIGYGVKDTKRTVRRCAKNIESALVSKNKFSRDSFQIVFDEKPASRFTRIYAWPKASAPNSYWIGDVKSLIIRD